MIRDIVGRAVTGRRPNEGDESAEIQSARQELETLQRTVEDLSRQLKEVREELAELKRR